MTNIPIEQLQRFAAVIDTLHPLIMDAFKQKLTVAEAESLKAHFNSLNVNGLIAFIHSPYIKPHISYIFRTLYDDYVKFLLESKESEKTKNPA